MHGLVNEKMERAKLEGTKIRINQGRKGKEEETVE